MRHQNSPQLQVRLFDRPYLLLVLTMLFWSGNFIVGRAIRGEVPPIGLAFWRWFGGFLIVLTMAWPHLKQDLPKAIPYWKVILLLSALGIASFNTLAYIGLQSTTAINGFLMQSVMPLIIVVMSFLFFGETVSWRQALGIGVSLTGAIAIIARGSWHTLVTLSLNPGDVLIFIAVVCYAAYSSLLRLRPAIHPLSFLATTFALGTLLLLPFYLWESLMIQPMPLTRASILAVGYVAVFPSIVSYFCYNRGVELVGASQAGLFIHLLPIFGSLMAMLFLGERFQLFHAVGMVLILAGILLFTARPHSVQSS